MMERGIYWIASYKPLALPPCLMFKPKRHQILIDIGLDETDFRRYDANLGRFTGVDALAEMYQPLTPYQYAANNPLMFNDPSGLESESLVSSFDSYSYQQSIRNEIQGRFDRAMFEMDKRIEEKKNIEAKGGDKKVNQGLVVYYDTNGDEIGRTVGEKDPSKKIVLDKSLQKKIKKDAKANNGVVKNDYSDADWIIDLPTDKEMRAFEVIFNNTMNSNGHEAGFIVVRTKEGSLEVRFGSITSQRKFNPWPMVNDAINAGEQVLYMTHTHPVIYSPETNEYSRSAPSPEDYLARLDMQSKAGVMRPDVIVGYNHERREDSFTRQTTWWQDPKPKITFYYNKERGFNDFYFENFKTVVARIKNSK
jgi:RHS repeat-associated protein